jgi:hypothetical protein
VSEGPVLLVELTTILGDLVRAILEELDISVVGDLEDGTGLSQAVAETGAGFVIWGCTDIDLPARVPGLFDQQPGLRVLAVEGDGQRGFLWQLEPHRRPIGELSPAVLVDLIRTPAR